MANILEIAKKLNKEYESKSFIRKSDVIPNYKRLRSAALGMDFPLYGGLPRGRICVYSGKPHSGKTTAAFAEIAAFQREEPNSISLFVDAEQSADLQFQALMNGVDLERLFVMTPPEGMSGEQILEAVLEIQLESDDIGMIVIDSIPALVAAQNLKNEFTKDAGKSGTIAKSLHKFCGEIIPSLAAKKNVLIFINQMRVKDTMVNGAVIYTEPGGDAPKFYSSVSVRFGTRSFMKEEKELSGENSGDGADGFRLKFSITKNKTAACNRGGGFITYRYTTGMDTLSDLIEVASSIGYITKNGGYYSLINLETGEIYKDENGKDLKGFKKNIISYLETHEEFKKAYIDMLFKAVSASNTQFEEKKEVHLLSEEDEAAIKAEEDSVVEE